MGGGSAGRWTQVSSGLLDHGLDLLLQGGSPLGMLSRGGLLLPRLALVLIWILS